MSHAAALAASAGALATGLKVLSLVEATELTGVTSNLVEFARVSAEGAGGIRVALILALIRRGAGSAIRSDGLRDYAVGAGIPHHVIVENRRYDRQVIESIRMLAATERPDIIETHHIKSHCLVALSGVWRRHAWLAFHHGYTQTDFKVRAYNHVDRWSLKRAAHVVTTNREFAATLASRGVSPERITILHNGVREMVTTPAAVAAVAHSLALRPGQRVVLAVGRLSREKGQEYLVRAAASCSRNIRLVFVGDGPDRACLEKLATSLRLGLRVTFAGPTTDVAPYYRLANVFALPSLSEGSPMVLLEAMAWGLPIVATHVGGVPEIAADGQTALLGPPRDPAFLAHAIDRLLLDRALGERLGSAARKTVLERHTPEQRATQLTELYAAVARSTCNL
jgi:glycosyltransferase involved in cell wall biosynthesis